MYTNRLQKFSLNYLIHLFLAQKLAKKMQIFANDIYVVFYKPLMHNNLFGKKPCKYDFHLSLRFPIC